ncbi:hypothetical protein [Aquabacterium sp.]|uniref:recombination directionality factor n=1 Tax=Aquabacterium sp. TaxID=1872578 RepID=UPI0035ADE6C3
MLKGLALTPPAIGRIAIGKVVEKNGKRLPEKDDEFTITSQVQLKDGWVLHPVDEVLRKDSSAKLRSIPVRLLFGDPDLSLRAKYTLFERTTGRPLCVGDGESCRRVTSSGMQSLPCPAPHACSLAVAGACKPYGRLHVRIDAGDSTGNEVGCDELGSFVFRTTGFNSIRTLLARLHYFHAVSGGLLATLPLELRLRGKSTTMSHRAPIYYVDLTTRTGSTLAQAMAQAKELHEARLAAGMDQAALDEAARLGLARGDFEETEEEGAAVVDEFYAQDDPPPTDPPHSEANGSAAALPRPGLSSRLGRKLAQSAQGVQSAAPEHG